MFHEIVYFKVRKHSNISELINIKLYSRLENNEYF